MKLGDYGIAEEYFQRALDVTELLGDAQAQVAISEALDDVKMKCKKNELTKLATESQTAESVAGYN